MTQAKIVAKIRKLGYKVTVLNAHPANRGGIPDIVLPIKGIPVFVEIKILPDKLSKLQGEFLDEYYASSFVLYYDPKAKQFSYVRHEKSIWGFATEVQSIVDKLNAL